MSTSHRSSGSVAGTVTGRVTCSALAATVTVGALSGCVIGDATGNRETVTVQAGQDGAGTAGTAGAPSPTPGAPAPGSDRSPAAPGDAGLDIAASYSVAWLDGGRPVTGGETGAASARAAWSTSKVPLAIAALRHDPATGPTVESALTESDNAAAEQLWASLGDPTAAGAAVQAVLREGGDATTTVQNQVVRPGFSAFGQTMWTTADQATFAGKLSCLPGAGPVLDAMGRISNGGGYGLGLIPGARFKGGWGPDESGAYQVRQFGLVPGRDGTQVPVSIAATSPDGSYEGGQRVLDEIVGQLPDRLAGVTGVAPGSC
ncbi:class A beta-lactamase-related serine hydrolase [Corynebacterium nuruki]|uniref:class A beta-lactamase-related serine hydrolase n=1 Tax=Corynebacterium nuruki TaxID=1032851 RepID=UPI001EE68F7E|nr:class A beta-lactamase-related serine hydrolase [Corynebacterium nuruki]